MTETIRARPTLYKGIRMRSRLEADYAAYLEREGHDWHYESECFASAAGQWLPDFLVKHKSGDETFLELKPAGRLDDDYMALDGESIDGHLTRMTIAWESKPAASLVLVYWQYGCPAVMEITSGCKGAPWLAQGGPLPLLWTGMGQFDRCDRG